MYDGAAQAFVFWIAGFETSSTTATIALYELALNQDIQDTLAKEINKVLAEFGGVTYDSINAMPYLHKVLSGESERTINGHNQLVMFVISSRRDDEEISPCPILEQTV